MKKQLTLLLALGAIVTLVSCGGTARQPGDQVTPEESIEKMAEPAAEGFKTYKDEKLGYGILHPEEWKPDTSGQYGTLAGFMAPVPDKEGDLSFAANVNVVHSPGTSLKQLRAEIDDYEEQMGTMMTGFKQMGRAEVEIGGDKGYRVGGTYTQGKFPLRVEQLLLADEGQLFVVTATALEAKWDDYKETFDTMLKSFRF